MNKSAARLGVVRTHTCHIIFLFCVTAVGRCGKSSCSVYSGVQYNLRAIAGRCITAKKLTIRALSPANHSRHGERVSDPAAGGSHTLWRVREGIEVLSSKS